MAAGAAPTRAPEVKAETKTDNQEPVTAQPATLKEHLKGLLHKIFQGREEFAGWRQ